MTEKFPVGRTQRVRIQNYISHHISVLFGVLQGSNCSPLLLLIFVNDIHLFIKEPNVLMFAADIYRPIKSQRSRRSENHWSALF